MASRQGTYSQPRDIVILCAYLGQLAKVQTALSDMVTVVVDERDERKMEAAGLDDSEEPDESSAPTWKQKTALSQVSTSEQSMRTGDVANARFARQVLVRTIDK